MESARMIAERMVRLSSDSEQQVIWAFRSITSRQPTEAELKLLVGNLNVCRHEYAADPQAAADLLSVGEYPADAELPKPQVAAAAIVASTILNLDESITQN